MNCTNTTSSELLVRLNIGLDVLNRDGDPLPFPHGADAASVLARMLLALIESPRPLSLTSLLTKALPTYGLSRNEIVPGLLALQHLRMVRIRRHNWAFLTLRGQGLVPLVIAHFHVIH